MTGRLSLRILSACIVAIPTAVSLPTQAADVRPTVMVTDLPSSKFENSQGYPQASLRQGFEGQVNFLFNIDAKGKPFNVSAISRDNPVLVKQATEQFNSVKFEVPSDWKTSGKESLRFFFRVYYVIAKGDQACPDKSGLFSHEIQVCGISVGSQKTKPSN